VGVAHAYRASGHVAVCVALITLASAEQSFGATITALYSTVSLQFGSQSIGPCWRSGVDGVRSSVLSIADVTGTYTLADNLHWTAIWNVGQSDSLHPPHKVQHH